MNRFLPVPYKDETFHSLLARYSVRSGNLSSKQTIKELYGTTTHRASKENAYDLNSLLDSFNNNNLNPESVLYRHTLMPLYSAFTPYFRIVKLEQEIYRGDNFSISSALGINASGISYSKRLKHCINCIREDMQNYGESYWRRLHQVPGVWLCTKHNTELKSVNFNIYKENQHKYFSVIKNMFDEDNKSNISLKERDFMIKYVREVEWLLNNRVQMRHYDFYKKKYINSLQKLGLANESGRVKQVEWEEFFFSNYGKGIFDTLRIMESSNNSWLNSIVRKNRNVFHPIRHILVILLFADSIKKYLDEKVSNSKKQDYKKVIATAEINEEILRNKREKWATHCSKFSCYSISELRRINPSLYMWLYRNDNKWLLERKYNSNKKRGGVRSVNWQKRDLQVLEELIEINGQWELNEQDTLIQKTISSFSNKTTKPSWLLNNREKMPFSLEFLLANIEDSRSFRVRRLKKITYIYSQCNLSKWQLFRKAGIRKEFLTEELEKIIEDL